MAELSELSSCHDLLTEARHMVRTLDAAITDREMELYSEHRGQFESQAAFDKGIKPILQADETLRNLRRDIMAQRQLEDEAEHNSKQTEHAIRIACARLTELGGLLNFYAAVKNNS